MVIVTNLIIWLLTHKQCRISYSFCIVHLFAYNFSILIPDLKSQISQISPTLDLYIYKDNGRIVIH